MTVENIQAIKAGVASAATVAITTNLEFSQVVFVGLMGAIAYFVKSCDFMYLKNHPWKATKTFPIRLLTPIALTGAIYYLGTDGFNRNVADLGHPLWLFVGLIAAMNYEITLEGFAQLYKVSLTKVKEWKQ